MKDSVEHPSKVELPSLAELPSGLNFRLLDYSIFSAKISLTLTTSIGCDDGISVCVALFILLLIFYLFWSTLAEYLVSYIKSILLLSTSVILASGSINFLFSFS